ncbi:MAG: hypothetical protein H7061_01065 [Bdellovibrionaceae bacterium]|nr:hypothetical protein [Bdellovibrio sp.]
MLAVKVLERKSIIQLFGICLTIAPFFNVGVMVWVQHATKNYHWNWLTIRAIASSGSLLQYALSLLSIVIGAIMLRGSKNAWKYVLFLLGCHILTQVGSIGQDIRQNWLWGPFFLVNVSVFIFIADQLVFKTPKPLSPQELKDKLQLDQVSKNEPLVITPEPALAENVRQLHPEPAVTVAGDKAHPSFPTLYTRKKTLIQFEGFGAWAQLISVSSHKIHVRCLTVPPVDFKSRKIEINFRNGLVLQTWLDRKSDQDFYFEYPPLNESQIELLDRWVRKHAA